jgi:starch synthase (maltosyl-transferring)
MPCSSSARRLRLYQLAQMPDADALGVGIDAAHDLTIFQREIERASELGFDHVVLSTSIQSIEIATSQCMVAARQGIGCVFDVQVPMNAGQAWADQVIALARSGAAGLRLMQPAHLNSTAWREILELARSAHHEAYRKSGTPAPMSPLQCLAWTPGLIPDQLSSLQPAGFDAVFCSLPWWDYRSTWLAEEIMRLRLLGRIVAAVSLPDMPAHDVLLARRALWTAAALGDDLMMPAGFDHGRSLVTAEREPLLKTQNPQASHETYDLSHEVIHANAWHAANPCSPPCQLRMVSGIDAPLTVCVRDSGEAGALVVVINPDNDNLAALGSARVLSSLAQGAGYLLPARGSPGLTGTPADTTPLDASAQLLLPPADIRFFRPVTGPAGVQTVDTQIGAAVLANLRQSVEAALQAPRIAIENVTPHVDHGAFAVRRVVGEMVEVRADVWIDGHDQLAVMLLWRGPGKEQWQETTMTPLGNDTWTARFPLTAQGRHEFTIEAWRDAYATWRDEVLKKRDASVSLTLETEEGVRLVEAALARSAGEPAHAIHALAAELADHVDHSHRRLELLLAPTAAETIRTASGRPFVVRHPVTLPIEADRLAARYGNWYELFPRSQSGDPKRHGTFDDVIARLPAIREMGFTVLYFPPIHPIGHTHRKGRNNSLQAQPDDPGSPYAIGSNQGGHDALHPELGSFEDFARLRTAAAAAGLEIALDFAIQCSPDHPWLRDHPEWFAYRPDGSLRYAENPPKKYEDIVNVDFYSSALEGEAAPELWLALREVVLFWIGHGVRIFRVDNPHTKPLPFWAWLIASVRAQHPDVVFLAEAFTRPRMMARLAKIGFAQSYTYFTWRNHKQELMEYMTELTQSPLREFYRPHFFVNTPDINPYFLHGGERSAFLIRAALASTLSGLWGMVSGYELCEHAPFTVNGVVKEEYLDSEKYQIRARDWGRPGNIVHEITRLNTVRANHIALQSHLGLRFCHADDPAMLVYLRYLPSQELEEDPFGNDLLLIVVNLDPHTPRTCTVELPFWEWGLADDGTLSVHDLLQDNRFFWHGRWQQVHLDPNRLPYAIWQLRRERPL